MDLKKIKSKIVCVVGTRPEAIKMAPIIKELEKSNWTEVIVIRTSQHKELLDDVLNIFEIKPSFDLEIMSPNQELGELTAKIISEFSILMKKIKPRLVLAQGDTTSAMAAALVSFYNKIKFGHVEAGLRTWDIYNPFPEEVNRSLISKLATFHFAPTTFSRDNLLKENINPKNIFVCGNTVIDSLLQTAAIDYKSDINTKKKFILITVHRRENFDKLKLIFEGLKISAIKNKNLNYIFPVHPNPNINDIAKEYFSSLDNFILSKPLNYINFVTLMKKSFFIVSDSGGVQEEAAALGKPLLILRSKTERMEVVNAKVARLVGVDSKMIINEIDRLILDSNHYARMAKKAFPYGNGKSAKIIVEILKNNNVDKTNLPISSSL